MYRNFVKSLMVTVGMGMVLSESSAYGFSHKYLNQTRSGTKTNVFVSQGVEGEYGKYTLNSKDEAANGASRSGVQNWQGYGLRTAVGVEVMKFIQFSANHTLSNMRTGGGAVQRLSGSKLGGEVRFVFESPLGNLEAGAGALGSRLDYQKAAEFASYYGSGTYYTMGVNYFMTPSVSVFGQAKMFQENLVRTSGPESLGDFRTNTTAVGAGFSLWI